MRTSLLPALLPLAVLAACNRASEPASVAPAATVAAPATLSTPATVVAAPAATATAPMGVSEAPAPGEHTAFDAKAFAGTFASEGMVVRFTADGTYVLSSHAADASPGTWTLEPDGRHLRLDPHAKGEADRVYDVLDKDSLRAANGPQVLRREGSAQ